jgi:hypothetical protein
MAHWGIWLGAVALYALFRGWYDNWRGPLRPGEVEQFMARFAAAGAGEEGRNSLAVLRHFLESDDGREFFMLNLIRLAPGEVIDPGSGAPSSAEAVLAGYTRYFLRALAMRAGHPALVAGKVGGYFDAWGVEADPGWTVVGYMRYRSRRDLAELAADPRFSSAHLYKFAAMAQTFSFPTRPRIMLLVGPRLWVALVLALLAALGQVMLLAWA